MPVTRKKAGIIAGVIFVIGVTISLIFPEVGIIARKVTINFIRNLF